MGRKHPWKFNRTTVKHRITPLTSSVARLFGAVVLLALPASGAEPVSAASTTSAWALGAEAGTLGYGPKLEFTPSPKWAVELGYTFLDYDDTYEDEDTSYDGALGLSNVQAIVRWHPWGGRFHLSAGAVFADNVVDLVGTPSAGSVYEIGDGTYTAAQIGQLTGHIDIATAAAPYLGLGWTKSAKSSGFGGFFNLGVMFSGATDVALAATGPINSDPTFQTNLRLEEQSIENDLSSYDIYPVIQGGLIWRF
jgi:hypothetical protein